MTKPWEIIWLKKRFPFPVLILVFFVEQSYFYKMVKAFIRIRWKQTFWGIFEIGLFRLIFITGLLVFVGVYVFLQTSKYPNSFYVSAVTLIIILLIHIKRSDKLFLKNHFKDFRLIFFTEYVILSSPIIIFLIWHLQWIPVLTILFATFLIVFINYKPAHRNLNTKLQKLIPAAGFEWKAGVRKTYFFTVLLWMVALCTSFYIASVPLVIFILGIISLSFYENGEPLQMLLAGEKNANQFLIQKIKIQLILFSIITFPLIVAFIIFHSEIWYIPVAEYFIFISLHIYTILTKYAFYSPNSVSPAAQTFSAIGAICAIVPFLIPVVWLLFVRFYFKSWENLNTYLYDYN